MAASSVPSCGGGMSLEPEAEAEAGWRLSREHRDVTERRVFPPKVSLDSEAEISPREGKLLDFLQEDDETVSDEILFAKLQALKIQNQQYLFELGTRYQAQSEGEKLCQEAKELEGFFQKNGQLKLCNESKKALRSGNLRGLIFDTSDHSIPMIKQRPNSDISHWASALTVPQPFKMTIREAEQKSKMFKANIFLEAERKKSDQESRDQAECQKKFRAQPLPAHIFLPLYQEMLEEKEARRHANIQKRKELLLSTQKPFSFLNKEERRNKEIQPNVLVISQEVENGKPKVIKKIPRSVQDSTVNDKLKEAELYRKIRIQMRAKNLLQKSSAPINICKGTKDLHTSISLKTKQEKMGFLQENFQFHPRINQEVPDFEVLYWAFQREAMTKHKVKEATRNKPFRLHTSSLHFWQKKNKERQKNFQQPKKCKLKKSHSVVGLSSLSPNTLPVYITDGAKKRDSAIKCSLEEKQNKEYGKDQWMESYRKRSQAMHKSVSRRAKLLDSHVPLVDVFKEKLKHHWLNDQKRNHEYKQELAEMKRKVNERPYLFEQLSKSDARKIVESQYVSTLNQVGLSEEFVNKSGRGTINLKDGVETHRLPFTVCLEGGLISLHRDDQAAEKET
uniref:Protein FAM161B isoform X2 n=1 Tax=Geotrypetes seraphini TaxID=260995 RepID=A0A6P8RMI1_GEOSA|nr:protein FAM161B isoform X2 [Geotrypetes seraphini]